MGSSFLSASIGLVLLCTIPWASVQSAVFSVEVTGQNPSFSGNQATNFSSIDQVQLSFAYNYLTSSDCSSAPCNDALIDLQVHLSDSSNIQNSVHWNLGKFVHNSGQSTGQLALSGNNLQLVSNEPIAGTAFSSVSPTHLSLTLSSISNIAGSGAPLDLPQASLATLCIGDAANPCSAANHVSIEFTPTFFQRQLPFQWANPLPLGNKITKIIWNPSHQQFLAVGHNASIMTSSNGIAWSMQGRVSTQFDHDANGVAIQVPSPYAMFDDINALVFANDRYVAVGRRFIAVSRFGIDWAYHNRPRGDFLDVTWDSILGSRYIVVGNWNSNQSNIVFSDADGLHWSDNNTQVVTGTRVRKIIAGGDARYYALESSSGAIMYSGGLSSGIWTSSNRNKSFNDILWDSSNNLAVAVGDQNAIVTGSASNWTALAMSTSPNAAFYSINNLGDRYIAAGLSTNCSNVLEFTLPSSVTLHNWGTQCSISLTPKLVQLSYDGSHYIASTDDRKLYLTDNLDNDWQLITRGHENDMHGAIYANGNKSFYAVGNNGYFAQSRDDGATWQVIPVDPSANASLNGVAADSAIAPVIIAVGAGGSVIRWDSSAATSASFSNEGSVTLRDVEWVGDQFIAVGDANRIISSSDGLMWNNEIAAISPLLGAGDIFNFSDVFYDSDHAQVFVLGTNTNASAVQKTLLLQFDQAGGSWTANNSPYFKSSNELFAMAYSGNTYVISSFGDNYDLLLSGDGQNWQRSTTGGINDSPISRLLWTGTQFIGIGPLKNASGGFVYQSWFQSADGYEWQKTRAPLNFNSDSRAYPLAISNSALIIGGGFGSMMYQMKNYTPEHRAQLVTLPNSVTGQAGTAINVKAIESDPATIVSRTWRFIPELSDYQSVTVNSSNDMVSLNLPDVPPALRLNNAKIVLRYSVVDDFGATSSTQTQVVVTPTNRVPTISALQTSASAILVEGELITITALVSDPDGDAITQQQWAVASGPDADLTACQNLSVCQVRAPMVSGDTAWTLRYTAVDVLMGSAEKTINFTIKQNQAPKITLPSTINMKVGETYVLSGATVVDDAPVSQLRVSWVVDSRTNVDPNVPVILNPNQLQPIIVAPPLLAAGPAQVALRLTVTDNLNKSDSASVIVNISPQSNSTVQAPQANAGPDIANIIAGAKVVLNAATTADPSNMYDYEWYYVGSYASNGTDLALPLIDVMPDTGDIKKASFVAPLNNANYYLVFNLRVTDNTLSTPLSSVDSVKVFVAAPTSVIDRVGAEIWLNGNKISANTGSAPGDLGSVRGGDPIQIEARNIRFFNAQQNPQNPQIVDVGSQDDSQFSFKWSSVNYIFGGFDAIYQSSVNFPPIATATGGIYKFKLHICDRYETVCSDQAFNIQVSVGGFAGPDQEISGSAKTVTLQFYDAGRTQLDTVANGDGYETALWEQISPTEPLVTLSGVNSAKATFSTSGLSKGDYVFRLTYSILGVPNPATYTDEVTITLLNDVQAYKPAQAKSTGGAFSHDLLILLTALVWHRHRRLRVQGELRQSAAAR